MIVEDNTVKDANATETSVENDRLQHLTGVPLEHHTGIVNEENTVVVDDNTVGDVNATETGTLHGRACTYRLLANRRAARKADSRSATL